MESQLRKYGRVVELWVGLMKAGKYEKEKVPELVYYGVTNEPPSAEIAAIKTAMELCDYFSRKDVGRPLNDEEKAAIAFYGHQQSHLPNVLGLAKAMLFMSNIMLIIAVVAVFYRSMSWWVIGLAIFARFDFGFARYLAAKDLPGAGVHATISTLAMLASIVISLLHISGYFQFR